MNLLEVNNILHSSSIAGSLILCPLHQSVFLGFLKTRSMDRLSASNGFTVFWLCLEITQPCISVYLTSWKLSSYRKCSPLVFLITYNTTQTRRRTLGSAQANLWEVAVFLLVWQITESEMWICEDLWVGILKLHLIKKRFKKSIVQKSRATSDFYIFC